jgi:membrane peptidoglycan carboxypeptidase
MSLSSRPPARSSSGSVLGRLGMALGTSVLAGLLVAAVAVPFVGAVGLSAKAAADEFLVLPAELETGPLAQRTRIVADDGSLLAVLYRENRVAVPLEAVPELTQKAVLAVEDARFYTHNGVDVKGTARAAVANARGGGVVQGGSTLTQQYVKNALLQTADNSEEQQAAREVSLERKLREARFALAIERELTKDQILERYLNIAYYSNGVYGIGTAANHYFAKSVRDLTLAEGALLAGVVQSPGRFDPVRNLDNAVTRRNVVLQRMREVGFITEAERAQAAAEQPQLSITPVGSGCEQPTVTSPFFCDYVRRALLDTDLGSGLGTTRSERQDKLFGGGLTIRTTLDPVMQAGAQEALERRVPREDRSQVAAVVNIVEPGTGQVKAMAVNRLFSEEEGAGRTKVNLALGGSQGMQAGSTFKPFVLAAALQMGIPESLTLDSPNEYTSSVFRNCRDNNCDEFYTLNNAGDSQGGTFDLRTGTHGSVNTFYIQLHERTGVERPAQLAELMGVKRFSDGVPAAPLLRGGSFPLGVDEVSPLDMASAYAVFASRGVHCPPRPVTSIVDAAGQEVPVPPQTCGRILDEPLADAVNDVLQGVIDGGSPGRTGRAASIGRPAAGKTGSTNGSRAAWFIGYTPQLATAVWVGKPVPVEMKRIRIGGRYYEQVYGGTLPAPIWQQTMRQAVRDLPVERFVRPDRSELRGDRVRVPDVRGLREDDARRALSDAGLGVREGGRVNGQGVREGRAVRTSPRAGQRVAPGSTVTLQLSNGRGRAGA